MGACHVHSGQCVCKEGVIGVKCSVCEVRRELFLPTFVFYDYIFFYCYLKRMAST